MFPRPPGKSPSGKLRLIIKPQAAAEVEAGPEPVPVQPGTDDNVIQFKLPLGFTLDTNIIEINKRQRAEAIQRIKDVEDRLNKCKPCRKKPIPDSIPNAMLLVNNVYDAFAEERTDPLTYVVGHNADGSFKIDLTFKDKSVSFVIAPNHILSYSLFSENMTLENEQSENMQESSVKVVQWLKQ